MTSSFLRLFLFVYFLEFVLSNSAWMINNFAGSATKYYNGDKITATAAEVKPYGLWGDTSGNLYIADYKRIAVISAVGLFSTVVGTTYNFGSTTDGYPATSTVISSATKVWLDSVGNVYYLDSQICVIRKMSVNSPNLVTTIIGTPSIGCTSTFALENSTGTATPMNYPRFFYGDLNGNLVYADAYNNRIRKYSAVTSRVVTIAGNGTAKFSGDGGPASNAMVSSPLGVFIDSNGNIYFGDLGNYRIRRISKIGIITTVAGAGASAVYADGPATSSGIGNTQGIFLDKNGNLFFVDSGCYCIRKVSGGIISTIAGTGSIAAFGSATTGIATSVSLNSPTDIWGDTNGNLFVADFTLDYVYKISGTSMTFFAGNGIESTGGDGGSAVNGQLYSPSAVYMALDGTAYIADTYNCKIRMVYGGIISTVIGVTGSCAANADGAAVTLTSSTSISQVYDVAVDSTGSLYFLENKRVKKLPAGSTVLTTLVGGGTLTSSNVAATSYQFNTPKQFYLDTSGNIYVTDFLGMKVKLYSSSTNKVNTFAGTGNTSPFNDNLAAASCNLYNPFGIWGDSNGIIYITEVVNRRVRQISVAGIIRVIAGTGNNNNYGTFPWAIQNDLFAPYGLTGDTSGNIYIADEGSSRVQKISPVNSTTYSLTTIAGNTLNDYIPGLHSALSASGAFVDVNMDTNGQLYVVENSPDWVRVVYQATLSNPTSQPTCQPTGQPSRQPTGKPTTQPTSQPTRQPISSPTGQPTKRPTGQPSSQPVGNPTSQPTSQPIGFPTGQPTEQPISNPSTQPTRQPTNCPTARPSSQPSCSPSTQPSRQPTNFPTSQPTRQPTNNPAAHPSMRPSAHPSSQPSVQPTRNPSSLPTRQPSSQPSTQPTMQPSIRPSIQPTSNPSSQPTRQPSSNPSTQPSCQPSRRPSSSPSCIPTSHPSSAPSGEPTEVPSCLPTTLPITIPSFQPSSLPSRFPSSMPTGQPSFEPTSLPSTIPSLRPSGLPSSQPSNLPFRPPSSKPSIRPSSQPTNTPSSSPSMQPFSHPSAAPSAYPSSQPVGLPPNTPFLRPSGQPTGTPSSIPSYELTSRPSQRPLSHPSLLPSTIPSFVPSSCPSAQPSAFPSRFTSSRPTGRPSKIPLSILPSASPSLPRNSSLRPTAPVAVPRATPVILPSIYPSTLPSIAPSNISPTSTTVPSSNSVAPSLPPTSRSPISPYPSFTPSLSSPTLVPSIASISGRPSPVSNGSEQSNVPTAVPSRIPTLVSSTSPTRTPSTTIAPTLLPTISPSTSRPSVPLVLNLLEDFPSKRMLFLLGSSVGTNSPIPSSNQAIMKPSPHNMTALKAATSYLLFGSAQLPSSFQLDLNRPITTVVDDYIQLPSFHLYRDDQRSHRLFSEIGDINHDGSVDQVVCYPLDSICYGFLGTSNHSSSSSLTVSFSLVGELHDSEGGADNFGWSVAALGDVNGDVYHDFIVCAKDLLKRCYVIFGRRKFPSTLSMASMSYLDGFKIFGPDSSIEFGLAVSPVGDFNGDGFSDLVISELAGSGKNYSFVSHVIFGTGVRFSADIYLGNVTNSFQVVSSLYSFAGLSLSGVGDVNGDGLDDLVIGSVPYQGGYLAQNAFIVLGRAVSGQDVIHLDSIQEDSGVIVVSGGGFMVAGIGDVNGDGLDDVMVVSYPNWIGQSNSYLLTFPTNVSSFPTVSPSLSPTVMPSLQPTSFPSTARPSLQPTPSKAPSWTPPPTSNQTTISSHPSPSPSSSPPRSARPTRLPLSSPSIVPTPVPTHSRPSTAPVLAVVSPAPLVPTVRPSQRPRMTPKPSHTPTLLPTFSQSSLDPNQFDDTIEIRQTGTFVQFLGRKAWFIVHLSPSLVDSTGVVTIVGVDDAIKLITFHPYEPRSSSALIVTIVVHDFHVQGDLLDFTLLPGVSQLTDLSFTTNPLQFVLSDHLLLQFPQLDTVADLSIHNLIFNNASSSSSRSTSSSSSSFIFDSSLQVAVGIMCVAMAGVFLCACIQSDEYQKEGDEIDRKYIRDEGRHELGYDHQSIENDRQALSSDIENPPDQNLQTSSSLNLTQLQSNNQSASIPPPRANNGRISAPSSLACVDSEDSAGSGDRAAVSSSSSSSSASASSASSSSSSKYYDNNEDDEDSFADLNVDEEIEFAYLE